MFAKKRILGVSGSTINMAPDSRNLIASAQPRNFKDTTKITASLGGSFGSGTGSANVAMNGFWQSQYQYYMTGLIPADPHLIDTSTLALFYRDMYLHDNVAGSVVDIKSTFPFSDWELRGLEQHELNIYDEALEQLDLRQLLPLITNAHLTDGFFCGSLVFDQRKKKFIDTLIHDALQCAVIPSPFWGIDPTINVRVGQATQQFLHDTSEFAMRYLNSMPQQFIEMLRSGSFTLSPMTSLFIPRRSTTDRAYTSYLHRLLPMYLIEKTLFRGTLTEAQRRQRAMTHITAGDGDWTPTGEELDELVRTFQSAEYDPLGGWISTRSAVQAADIRPGGDFWKWTDMSDILVPYKLRALGVSEAFMANDANYASAESAYSTFLETENSFRVDLTHRIFYAKLFPLIAVANGLYKDPNKKAQSHSIQDFLFNRNNRNNLKMPELIWTKELETRGEDNMFELLEKASEKGVPVPLKMWMSAAHLDPETLIRELKEDPELRKKFKEFTGKDTSHDSEVDSEFDDNDTTELENEGQPEYTGANVQPGKTVTTQSLRNIIANPRKPLLARDFGDSGDTWTLTKTGKVKYIPSAAMPFRRAKSNDAIMKIAQQADRDPEYREQLKRRNREKLGRTTLPD